MKIERLTKDNVQEFIHDLDIDDNELERQINKLEYYGVREDDKFYMAFIVLAEDDRIAIQFISRKLSDSKFLEFIDYLNASLVVKNRLIIQVYEKRYMNVLEDNYRCKDILMSLVIDDSYVEDTNSRLKEAYAEIDMHNIKYLCSDKKVICNLMKQNIQDEDVIRMLNDYFISLDFSSINFVISVYLEELFQNMKYSCLYRSYVIEEI